MAKFSKDGWIGVDFDCTLATYDGNSDKLGKPIPLMVERVRRWLAEGKDVRIFTARVNPNVGDEGKRVRYAKEARVAIQKWCYKHFGKALPVTHEKDFMMVEMYDDRCVTIEANTGKILTMGREDSVEVDFVAVCLADSEGSSPRQ